MTVCIDTKELLDDIRDKFLTEVPPTTEDKDSGKTGPAINEREFERSLMTTDSSMRSAINRFLITEKRCHSANDRDVPETLTYEFTGMERRLSGKDAILGSMMHDCLREGTLAGLFSSIAPEQSAAHASTHANLLVQLNDLMHTKRPPILSI